MNRRDEREAGGLRSNRPPALALLWDRGKVRRGRRTFPGAVRAGQISVASLSSRFLNSVSFPACRTRASPSLLRGPDALRISL